MVDQTNLTFDNRWYGAVIPKEHWHFHKTLLERYGIVLAPGDFSLMLKAILFGEAQLMERRPHEQAIYSIRINSVRERIYVLASVGKRRIITAWPPNRRLNAIRRRRAQLVQMNNAEYFSEKPL